MQSVHACLAMFGYSSAGSSIMFGLGSVNPYKRLQFQFFGPKVSLSAWVFVPTNSVVFRRTFHCKAEMIKDIKMLIILMRP